MNYARILGITNWVLMLTGYQLHWLEPKSGRYRLSVWTVGYFAVITIFYAICFTHHFEHSVLLQLLHDISPFLERLVRLQLLVGVKVFLFGIYELRLITRAGNELVSVLPQVYAKKFSRKEAYAYFLNFSTLFIAFGICLYVAIEMEFELPPLDNILVFCGLLIPHFVLGGALKMFNVGTWLLREQILNLDVEFQYIFPAVHSIKVSTDVETAENVTNTSTQHVNVQLAALSKKLSQVAIVEQIFNSALRPQLTILMALNVHCLLAGSYSRVYYETKWNVFFMQRTKNVFQATNIGIFILIIWDYITLGLTYTSYEKVKQKFTNNVYSTIKQYQKHVTTRFMLSDLHGILRHELGFKLPGSIKLNMCIFFMLQVLVALDIALIVIYHYFNDQISELTERIDGLSGGDD